MGSPDRHGKKRSMSTMNRIKSTFRSFFTWAFRSGIVRYDYTGFIYLGKARSRPTIPMTLTEVRQFLSTIRVSGDKNKLRDEALFSIYAFTGLRRSEVVRLQIVDYDSVENKILASRTKGGEPRIHPVPSLLSDILNQWIQVHHGNMLNVQDGPLFPGQHINHPITARQA
jgi:integrase